MNHKNNGYLGQEGLLRGRYFLLLRKSRENELLAAKSSWSQESGCALLTIHGRKLLCSLEKIQKLLSFCTELPKTYHDPWKRRWGQDQYIYTRKLHNQPAEFPTSRTAEVPKANTARALRTWPPSKRCARSWGSRCCPTATCEVPTTCWRTWSPPGVRSVLKGCLFGVC